jgi:hypothetical protein
MLMPIICNGEFYNEKPSEAFDFLEQLADNIK